MPEIIDPVARAQINSHERECIRREEVIDRRFGEVKQEIRDLKKLLESRYLLIWSTMGAGLIAALSGVVQLIKPFFHP